MTMTDTPLDFEKVELVREKMQLTIGDMAKLFGVTRATYYAWVRGGKIRQHNVAKVKDTLRQVLPLLRSGEWPPSGSSKMSSGDRLDSLLEILGAEE